MLRQGDDEGTGEIDLSGHRGRFSGTVTLYKTSVADVEGEFPVFAVSEAVVPVLMLPSDTLT